MDGAPLGRTPVTITRFDHSTGLTCALLILAALALIGCEHVTVSPFRESRIVPGQSVVGRLASGDAQLVTGEFYDEYAMPVEAGDRVSLSMFSEEFDTYLPELPPWKR